MQTVRASLVAIPFVLAVGVAALSAVIGPVQ